MKSCLTRVQALLVAALALVPAYVGMGEETIGVSVQEGQSRPSTTDQIAVAKSSVLRLDVLLVDGGRAGGTGFLVSGSPGLVVTNFHVVEGASEVRAIDVSGTPLAPMVPVALAPQFDLAILAAEGGKQPSAGWPQGLRLRSSEPREGEEAWALGYPELGFSVTKGAINAVRPYAKLPEFWKDVLNCFDKSAVFVQTDCTINGGNSGGPLIDANGEVVGVATMSLIRFANSNFAMSARHVESLLKSKPSKPTSFPPPRKGATSGSQITWPSPLTLERATEKELKSAFQALRRVAKCSACSGTGKAKGQSTAPSGSPGESGRISTYTRKCAKCDGSGVGQADVILRWTAKFSSCFSRAETDLREERDLREAMRKFLSALLRSAVASELDESMNADAFSRARNEKASPERAMVLVARYGGRLQGMSGSDPPALLTVGKGGRAAFVIVTSPRLVEGQEGEQVLVGGVCSGVMILESGAEVVVLQDGFVVDGRD